MEKLEAQQTGLKDDSSALQTEIVNGFSHSLTINLYSNYYYTNFLPYFEYKNLNDSQLFEANLNEVEVFGLLGLYYLRNAISPVGSR
ncbi:hypothetical protein ABEB36_005940 [Hypothenemus hampei]|uniref:Uncharacterized protein n=1 Tax=Hypothenemus hampei TaxID=57062 RepID=A0ABD1F0L6_HYPHA